MKLKTLALMIIVTSLLATGACSSEKEMDQLLFPGETPTKPNILATNPIDGDIGFPVESAVSVLFDIVMDKQKTQDAFRLSSEKGQVDGGFSWEWNRLIFKPKSLLKNGKYTMSVSSVAESERGVDLGKEYVVQFFVGHDIEPPRFLSSSPVSGEVDVSAGSLIKLTFSEPISYSSIADGLQISPAFNYTISLENGGSVIVLTPSNPLPKGTIRISLNQRLTDINDNSLISETKLSFTVGSDFIAPGIISIQSGPRTLVDDILIAGILKTDPLVIEFAEPMNKISVEEAITLTPALPIQYTWISDEELHLYPQPSLQPETQYNLRIASTAQDQQGNSLERTLQYPFLTDHPDSIRPRLVEVRQFASTMPAIPCSDNASRSTPQVALEALSPIDTSQWIDVNPNAGAKSCVLQFRFLFNNEMVRSSLVDSVSATVILHPTGDLISLQIYDLQMAPSDNHVMVLFLSGTFPPKGINETPIIRLSVQGGEHGARDINGNSMIDDSNLYLSY